MNNVFRLLQLLIIKSVENKITKVLYYVEIFRHP
jgi:hypothetical protein